MPVRRTVWMALLLGGCASGTDKAPECAVHADCAPGSTCQGGACVPTTRDRGVVDRGVDQMDAAPGDALVVEADEGVADAARPVDAEPMDAEVVDAGRPDMMTACRPGEVGDCGRNAGRCRAGRRVCGPGGDWGPCEGEVGPEDEICNGADDDCNGIIDDGFGVGEACDGVGACGMGVVECRNAVLTRCSTDPGGRRAEDRGETCDGRDEDCDGQTDEDFDLGQPCEGACGAGVRECGAGGQVRCSTDPEGSAGAAGPEVCDGQDQDCDGQIDEGFDVGAACAGVGACGAGVLECADGATRCSSSPGASADASRAEACNQLDDDCDGRVDEGFPVGAACEAQGRCGAGVRECGVGGALVCSTAPGGSADRSRVERCDGVDEDCDGAVDEGLGLGDACPAQGACAAGQLECAEDGGLRCDTRPGGSRDQSAGESCNGLDDDCDGAVDEALDAGEICGGDVCGPDAEIITVAGGRTGDTRGLNNDYRRSSCVPDTDGPDQALRFDAEAGPHVVGVAPLDAGFEPVFWVAADCAEVDRCVGGVGRVGATPKAARINLPRAGAYTIVVDSRDVAGGRYAIDVREAEAGETCGTAVRLTLPARFVGTLDGRENDHASAVCPRTSLTTGAEQAFRVDLAAASRVGVRLVGDGQWLPTVALVRDCGTIDEAACAAAATAAGMDRPVELSADLAAGTYFVLVERPRAAMAGGTFFLEVWTE